MEIKNQISKINNQTKKHLEFQVKAKGTEGEHLILTGGDDCMVVLSRLVVKKNKRVEVEKTKVVELEVEKTKGGEAVEMHMVWASTSSNWSHSAQVVVLQFGISSKVICDFTNFYDKNGITLKSIIFLR